MVNSLNMAWVKQTASSESAAALELPPFKDGTDPESVVSLCKLSAVGRGNGHNGNGGY